MPTILTTDGKKLFRYISGISIVWLPVKIKLYLF
jgi:hypothetical protein